MTATDALSIDYFLPPKDTFWGWSPDGKTLVTRSGKTICFSQEIEEVLLRLKSRGLPPLGAVVLLVAACRDGWNDNAEIRGALAEFSYISRRKSPVAPPNFVVTDQTAEKMNAFIQKEKVGTVLRELDRLAGLRAELRRSIGAKAALAEYVFETSRRVTSPREADALIAALRNGIPALAFLPNAERDGPGAIMRDLDALAPLQRLSTENLELRCRTGLDQLVVPAENADLPAPQRVRLLLDALRQDTDPDLAGLARLAQNLMAAVHVPRTLTPDEELPLGGFTDIANRGPLDRLLSSELAHDDLTLAVRIALNEALYLRRESPPRSPPEQRAMLLDSGIRMWGLPRVFGAAVALALTATTGERVAVRSFRAHENGLVPADLTTRDGLIVHLAALETAPHPGAALKPFFDALEKEGATTDTLLVTHPDALADPDFRAALAALPDADFYAATVDRDGTFRFLHATANGQTLLREAKLALDTILSPERQAGAVPLRDPSINTDLPAVLTLEPFPLLVPHPVNPRRAIHSPKHGVLTITDDGRLTQWTASYRGPKQLSAAVPAGKLVKLLIYNDAEVLALIDPAGEAKIKVETEQLDLHFVLDDPSRLQTPKEDDSEHRLLLYRYDLESGASVVPELPVVRNMPRDALVQGGTLILVYERAMYAYSLVSGMKSDELRPQPGMSWVRGRFFRRGDDWFALDSSQGKLGMEAIDTAPPNSLALIDREGVDGPWALTAAGEFFSSVPGVPAIHFPTGGRVSALVGVSANGHILAVELVDHPKSRFILDAHKEWCSRVQNADDLFPYLESDTHKLTASAPRLPMKMSAVAIGPDGRIILFNAREEAFGIFLSATEHLEFRDYEFQPELVRGPLNFVPVPAPPGARYEIGVARFADGSRIFFDSRGMVHLKSSDPTMPETTLVLNRRNVFGWSSDGKKCGLTYFAPPGNLTNDKHFDERIKRFTQRLR